MEWKPNKVESVPIYKQIADYMETRIMNGEYPSGSCLPSERFLAAELGVNRGTVIAAYDELLASGLVKKVKGIGTVVSQALWGEGPQKRIPNWGQYVKSGFSRSITRLTSKSIRLSSPEITSSISLSGNWRPIFSLSSSCRTSIVPWKSTTTWVMSTCRGI